MTTVGGGTATMTEREAAALSVNVRTVRRWLKAGGLLGGVERRGRSWAIPVAEVARLRAERERRAATGATAPLAAALVRQYAGDLAASRLADARGHMDEARRRRRPRAWARR